MTPKMFGRIMEFVTLVVAYVAGAYAMYYVDRVEWSADQNATDIRNNSVLLLFVFFIALELAYNVLLRIPDDPDEKDSPHV